jgi:muramoyltetrapeptide carboxypeptidase
MRVPLYPAPLNRGDTLGIFAPAGKLPHEAHFRQGVAILQEMGFHVKFPQNLWPGQEYLADSDEKRGHEFNRLVQDVEIKGLISARGGYGCLRMLDKIDIDAVVDNPKIVVGLSDITILQNYLYERTGLVSLHGPVVTSLPGADAETLTGLYSCLTHMVPQSINPENIEILRQGPDMSAPLVGGNLASLVTLLGTPYDFSWDKKIVFLEDINEPVYKIDRMLTQLKLAGKLDNIAGLILGDFSTAGNQNDSEKRRYLNLIWKRALDLCPARPMPIWGNFPSGHCSSNLTFPLGATVLMKSRQIQLLFL